MAEAWTRHLRGDEYEAYSAGTSPRGLDHMAVHVMSEAGVDISSQQSKDLESLSMIDFDYVVTLCDSAKEACPHYLVKTKLIHKAFDDPPDMAKDIKKDKEIVDIYRRVRDEIKTFITQMSFN